MASPGDDSQSQGARRPDPADVLALRALIEGTRIASAVTVVARLGVPDLLAAGPLDAAALAERAGADRDALYRVLRALVYRGLLEETDEGFALTPRGNLLRSDVPGSLREWALWHGSKWSLGAWAEFEHSVRTGGSAFEQAFGAPFFAYLAGHPEMATTFADAMVSISRQIDEAVVEAYDFGTLSTITDLGGGRGALLATVLHRYPKMRGTLFDLPAVIPHAAGFLSSAGVADRATCVGGDFFREVPTGADAYVLKAILHDWNDDQVSTILGACRRAMAGDATLVVLDMVLPERGTPSPIAEMDIQMLAMQTGRERTESEFRTLLAGGGFELCEVRATASPMSVVIARPR